MGGVGLLRKVWEKVVQIYERVESMTQAESLLEQSRNFIARLQALLDAAMQQNAAKDAEIAALKDELAKARIPVGITLTDEQYTQLLRDIAAGNAKLDEAERAL